MSRAKTAILLAVAAGLPLYTRNPNDFAGLSGLLTIVAL